MKNNLIIGISIFMVMSTVFIYSCKNDLKQSNNAPKTELENLVDTIERLGHVAETKPFSIQEVLNYHKQATEIIKFRISNKPKSYAILDVGKWEYEATFKDGKISSELKGNWIDFDEKNNYQYGNTSGQLGTGKYHFDLDTGLLLLVDDKSDIMPEEYALIIKDHILIMQGRNTFGSNSKQMKLNKILDNQ